MVFMVEKYMKKEPNDLLVQEKYVSISINT